MTASISIARSFLVSHGKSGALGCFVGQTEFARGDGVIVEGPRGREVGTILCPASDRQTRLMGPTSTGIILGPITVPDEIALKRLRQLEQRLFDASRSLATSKRLAIEVLDVDVLLDRRAIVQYLASEEQPLDDFAEALSQAFHLEVRLENLHVEADKHVAEMHPDGAHKHGCGKPDCGKTGGGCSSSGGGCSSCGSSCGSAVSDLRPYFAHLRAQLEARATPRTPLL